MVDPEIKHEFLGQRNRESDGKSSSYLEWHIDDTYITHDYMHICIYIYIYLYVHMFPQTGAHSPEYIITCSNHHR